MNDIDPLVLHFAETHPHDVAGLLDAIALQERIAFIRQLPLATGAIVVARLSSRSMSEVLPDLPDETLASIVLDAERADRTIILAHVPGKRYTRLIEAIPDAQRAALRRVLDMPSTRLSAIVSTDFIRVSADSTCGALKQELEAQQAPSRGPIFVVDRESRYVGILPPLAVLPLQNAEMPVARHMQNVSPLFENMQIDSAADAPQWASQRVLPVVDSNRYLTGAITLEAINQHRRKAGADYFGLEHVIETAATSYIDLCADLLEVVTGRVDDDRE